MPTVTFATACWKRDWRQILLDPDYLGKAQISRHCFPFAERLLVINNVDQDLPEVLAAAQKKVQEGIIDRFVLAHDVLLSFQLHKEQFTQWQYYNALAPLMAIYECRSEYLLYVTGDVYLERPVSWIEKAIAYMKKEPRVKVANLTWNGNYREAKKESSYSTWNFYVAEQGFSDQMFLVRIEDFRCPIYGVVRGDAAHYPRGDVFEARVFSHMKNSGWKRATYRWGSYIHK